MRNALYLLLVMLSLAGAFTIFVLWLNWKKPLGKFPRYKFNHWLPRFIGAGAMCFFGYCFVANSSISSRLRAHEQWHHLMVLKYGRVRHLVRLGIAFAKNLAKYGLKQISVPGYAKPQLLAYWQLQEEIDARANEANHTQFRPLP
jgi:hypothetical protein